MSRHLELFILFVTLPLWGVCSLLLICVLALYHRPIFFRQTRPGLNAKPFTLIKFRTMRDGSEPDAQRLTRTGRFLRATSLDELPELWLILRGTMALVGPRPLLMEYLATYSPEQMHRHDVRPGLTGWAQIHGRNAITLDQKVAYDLDYIQRRNTRMDLEILLKTFLHLKGN